MKALVLLTVLFLSACSTRQPVASSPASGPAVWYRADAGVTANDGKVSSWADQSGNGNDAEMTTAAQQPVLASTEFRGRPVIRFGGTHSLVMTAPVSPREFTVFVVGRNRMPPGNFSMVLGPAGGIPDNQLRWEDGSQVLYVGADNGVPPTRVPIGDTRTAHILALRYDGSVMKVWRDGRLVSQASFAASGPWTLNQIGGWYSTRYMVGDLAELLIYPSALPEGDVNRTTLYLRAKYF